MVRFLILTGLFLASYAGGYVAGYSVGNREIPPLKEELTDMYNEMAMEHIMTRAIMEECGYVTH